MINLLICEFIKLRKSRMFLLIFLAAFLPAFLMMIPYLMSSQSAYYELLQWDQALIFSLGLMNLGLGIVFFPLLGGYIFAREYVDKTVDTFMTYPYRRGQLFGAKFLVLMLLIGITMGLAIVFSWILGLIPDHEPLRWLAIRRGVFRYFLSWGGHVLLMPAAIYLAISSRNYIAPIMLGISASIVNLVIMQSGYVGIFAWAMPLVLILPEKVVFMGMSRIFITAVFAQLLLFGISFPCTLRLFKGKGMKNTVLILLVLLALFLPLGFYKSWDFWRSLETPLVFAG